jgi:hypothetical protein
MSDPALEELKQAASRLVSSHPEVKVSSSRTGDQTKECLVLTVESAIGASRYLRIHSTDDAEYPYTWLWSSYRAPSETDNCDGRGLGDLRRTVDVITHWIIDGRRWQDVPEFRAP